MELKNLTENQLNKFILNKLYEHEHVILEKGIGINYYNGHHDIEKKQRTAIGEDGRINVIQNLPNTQIKDNQYKRAVDQKVNYLFSAIPSVESDDENLSVKLQEVFNKRFLRTINKIAVDTYNTGIGWIYVYVDNNELKYQKLNPLEIIPIWKDDTHEKLEGVIRITTNLEWQAEEIVEVKQVYLFLDSKIHIYKFINGSLLKIEETSYIKKGEQFYNFGKIPFVYFKMPTEKSLIFEVKNLQDALNTILSNFVDNMLEDPRNTILIIKNYDGTDLGDFRQKLAQYGAVKVIDGDGYKGGVESLQIEVNHLNYEAIVKLLKKSIKENARIVDLDDEKNSPNMLNIKSMYADMELDANQLELEFTASFEYLLYFVKQVYNLSGEAVITLKRNIMVNEESKVDMLTKLVGVLSEETILSELPYVQNVDEEIAKLTKERNFGFDVDE